MSQIKVGIVMGSQSDWPTMKHAADILDALAVPYEAKIVSAHRTPDRLWSYGKTAAERGLQVIIAGAGGATHLPDMLSSKTRIPEKDFLTSLGLSCAPYANVETAEDLIAAVAKIGTPSILKTRRFGYDGKGQSRLKPDTDPTSAWADLGNTPCVLEGLIDFTHEVSVIGARSQSGEVVCFDPGENVHRDGILHTTTLPARLSKSQHMDAILATGKILNELDYVGVIGVEFFVTPQGLIINEIAPRVHNSGHWTQNGCVIDQFEQHIRAVAGWPLGDGQRHSNVTMTNLIGDEVNAVANLSKDAAVGLHLYGKAEAKTGRKMGHINKITGPA